MFYLFIFVDSLSAIWFKCCLVNWRDWGLWGLNSAHPKDVSRGFWSPCEEEFKDRPSAQQRSVTQTGKFTKAESTRDVRAGRLERKSCLPELEFCLLFLREGHTHYWRWAFLAAGFCAFFLFDQGFPGVVPLWACLVGSGFLQILPGRASDSPQLAMASSLGCAELRPQGPWSPRWPPGICLEPH